MFQGTCSFCAFDFANAYLENRPIDFKKEHDISSTTYLCVESCCFLMTRGCNISQYTLIEDWDLAKSYLNFEQFQLLYYYLHNNIYVFPTPSHNTNRFSYELLVIASHSRLGVNKIFYQNFVASLIDQDWICSKKNFLLFLRAAFPRLNLPQQVSPEQLL